jgi:tRNA pseudouridine65 synthase
MDLEILYEDDYIIIVNKPNNILIHNSYYARNIKEPTLLDLLFEQLNHHFFPVHRLDRKTSGVLLLTKNKTTVSLFQELFNSNSIQKTYLSIVRGFIDKTIKIDTPVKNPETMAYKEANTYCEPLLTKSLNIPVKPFDTSRYSLVKLIPTTGRMHQLRIHMNKISHPIVCDSKYGDRFHNRMFEEQFNCNNIFLHAYTLNLKHPITQKQLTINAELPTDWYTIFNKFKWKI